MSKLTPEISAVIPLFNEEESILDLHTRLAQTLNSTGKSYEIVFVDDGSTDSSLTRLLEIQALDTHVRIVELARNFGQTACLAAGIDHARGEIIVTMDGDLQHAPEDIPRLLASLEEGYDIVSGWREVRTDGFLLRRLPSRAANRLMACLSGLDMTDFGSTFKAYRASTVKQVELFGELHRFIPVLAHRIGARIREIPIKVHPRVKGVSKYGIGRVFGVFEDIIFLEFYTKYLTKPLRAFGKLFFIFFGTGFLISFVLIILWAIGMIGAVIQHAALLMLSIMLMIVGVQFFALGVLAEILVRIYLLAARTKIYTIRHVHEAGS